MERGLIARIALIAMSVGILGLMACASSQTSTTGPETGSEWNEGATERSTERGTDRSTSKDVAKIDLGTVYFDFDRFDIRADARPILRENAQAITASSAKVTIAGNCDERGSAEYNLALGERRANAVKRYLVDLGVPSTKLRPVSFGEERAAVQGHDESAWRYNRRADFSAGS